MKLGVGLIIFLLILQVTVASEYYINIKSEGESIFVNHFISLDNSEEIQITLPENYEGLTVSTNYSIMNSSLSLYGEKVSVSYIQLKTDSFGDLYYFLISAGIKKNISKVFVDLFLDKNFIFNKELSNPKRFEIITYGDSQIISWKFDDFSRGELLLALEKQEKTNFYYLLAAVILVIIFAGVIILLRSKRSKNEHLLPDEAKVIEILRGSEKRESWQRKIQEETGFSKAKLSRIIRNLVARELVEKIPIGNTNKVRLQ